MLTLQQYTTAAYGCRLHCTCFSSTLACTDHGHCEPSTRLIVRTIHVLTTGLQPRPSAVDREVLLKQFFHPLVAFGDDVNRFRFTDGITDKPRLMESIERVPIKSFPCAMTEVFFELKADQVHQCEGESRLLSLRRIPPYLRQAPTSCTVLVL
jgi:hypothetical protein